jgi:hypothetical protein
MVMLVFSSDWCSAHGYTHHKDKAGTSGGINMELRKFKKERRKKCRERSTCRLSTPRLMVPATTVPTPGTPNVSSMINSTGSARRSAQRCRCGVRFMNNRNKFRPCPVTADVKKMGAKDSDVIALAHVTTSCTGMMRIPSCTKNFVNCSDRDNSCHIL